MPPKETFFDTQRLGFLRTIQILNIGKTKVVETINALRTEDVYVLCVNQPFYVQLHEHHV
jgi:hypothetical protein